MILGNIRYVIARSRPFRRLFGQWQGLLFWLSIRRDYKLPVGTSYLLRIPGLRHRVTLRAGTSDFQVLEQVICSKETEFQLDSPHLIIDAGANIGLTSIVLASQYPQSKVVALEVEKSNYDLLCANAAPYPNIVPVMKALWSTDGFVKIANPDAGFWSFRVVETVRDDPDAISAVSLETLLQQSGEAEISLLKIDIEGAEKELFQSGSHSWMNRTKVIAVELHDRFKPGCTGAFEDLLTGRTYREHRQGEYRVVQFSSAEVA